MTSIFICLFLLLMIIAFPWVFDAIDNTLTEEYTLTFASVDTGAGVNSANVTLTESLWNNAVAAVQEISSNLTGIDTPSAATYNSVSRILTVNGLGESRTRTLQVDYLITSTTLPDLFDTVFVVFRWLYIFVVLALEAGAIYSFTKT